MQFRPLGSTGVTVSELCLGTMMFGAYGNTDHEDSIRVIHRALDAGINFLDTADGYAAGESETIVGKALAGGRRDDVILATKVNMPMGKDPNQRGLSRRWITTAVEDSLRRLGTDWIDLYQIHRPDPTTDIDETLGVMSDLVHQGKIRYIGHSTVPASQIVEAQWTSERRSRERFRTEQPPYSILARGIEHDVLPTCKRYGMGVLVYSPLNGGWLSGKYRKNQEIAGPGSAARRERFANRYDLSLAVNQHKLDATEALAVLAEKSELSLVQMALGFATTHPAVSAAIIGPRTMEHLESQLAAADVVLPADVLNEIDAIVPPGVNIHPDDHMSFGGALTTATRRR